MVYGAVQQMEGFITIDSVVGSGTTFGIYFPQKNGPIVAEGDSWEMERTLGNGEMGAGGG